MLILAWVSVHLIWVSHCVIQGKRSPSQYLCAYESLRPRDQIIFFHEVTKTFKNTIFLLYNGEVTVWKKDVELDRPLAWSSTMVLMHTETKIVVHLLNKLPYYHTEMPKCDFLQNAQTVFLTVHSEVFVIVSVKSDENSSSETDTTWQSIRYKKANFM